MDSATPTQPFAPLSTLSRRKGPPPSLRLDAPQQPAVTIAQSESSTCLSNLSSAVSDADSFIIPSPSKSRPSRNMKKLSLTLPSAQSSTSSLHIPEARASPPKRKLSVASLPSASLSTTLRRTNEDEDGSDAPPYAEGPIQILPGLWLGSEDNARDWRGLVERGVRSILNVAKEVALDFDAEPKLLRSTVSTPDLKASCAKAESTYYPAHVQSGRPSMHYLKLPWSHGQADLVHEGFPAAMSFIDDAFERGDGVLIHCQCGVSRSATLVIAVVMRAAAQRSASVPPEVWALKGMQGAYSFVKEKSSAVGPNMSLIYQLMDYERTLNPDNSPGHSDGNTSEEEWGRQRMLMEERESDRESIEMEAKALDRAMEVRMIARKSSQSSIASGSSRTSRLQSRKRAGSIASVATTGSIMSETLVEENEEQELLGVGSGFDRQSVETSCSSAEAGEDDQPKVFRLPSRPVLQPPPKGRRVSALRVPPSAPAHKSSFALPPVPATAAKATFDLPPVPRPLIAGGKGRRRPPPLGILPPVPSSPIVPVNVSPTRASASDSSREPSIERPRLAKPPPIRTTPARSSTSSSRSSTSSSSSHLRAPHALMTPLQSVFTPSQTLFVFPPEPLTARTPSTMTLMSNAAFPPASPATARPRLAPRSGLSLFGMLSPSPATPTVASSRVDVRGWFGLEQRTRRI